MIDYLDRTLEAMLKAGLPTAIAGQVAISFLAPDPQFPPTTVAPPAIDLFLYDVRENRDLRTTEWIVDPDAGTRRAPPVRLTCSYLITAWAASSSDDPARDEHRLLGEVIRVLLRHPTIPADALKGVLADQPLPLPTASLQAGPLQGIGEFWTATGRPKAVLAYTVTLTVEAVPSREAGPPVKEALVEVHPR